VRDAGRVELGALPPPPLPAPAPAAPPAGDAGSNHESDDIGGGLAVPDFGATIGVSKTPMPEARGMPGGGGEPAEHLNGDDDDQGGADWLTRELEQVILHRMMYSAYRIYSATYQESYKLYNQDYQVLLPLALVL